MICDNCQRPISSTKQKEIIKDIIIEYHQCGNCNKRFDVMYRNARVDELLIERKLLPNTIDKSIIEKAREIDNKILTEMAELELIVSDR